MSGRLRPKSGRRDSNPRHPAWKAGKLGHLPCAGLGFAVARCAEFRCESPNWEHAWNTDHAAQPRGARTTVLRIRHLPARAKDRSRQAAARVCLPLISRVSAGRARRMLLGRQHKRGRGRRGREPASKRACGRWSSRPWKQAPSRWSETRSSPKPGPAERRAKSQICVGRPRRERSSPHPMVLSEAIAGRRRSPPEVRWSARCRNREPGAPPRCAAQSSADEAAALWRRTSNLRVIDLVRLTSSHDSGVKRSIAGPAYCLAVLTRSAKTMSSTTGWSAPDSHHQEQSRARRQDRGSLALVAEVRRRRIRGLFWSGPVRRARTAALLLRHLRSLADRSPLANSSPHRRTVTGNEASGSGSHTVASRTDPMGRASLPDPWSRARSPSRRMRVPVPGLV